MKILMLISSLDVGGAETHVCELARELCRVGEEVVVVSRGGRISDALAGCGVKQIKLPLDSHSPIILFMAYRRLRAVIREYRPDVIHAHSRIAAYVGAWAAEAEKVPIVTTVHAKFKATPIKKYMTRWGYYVSAVSEDLAKYLHEVYEIPFDRIRIIPNGVDTARFSPREREKGRGTRILFVSRLDKDCSRVARSLCSIAPSLVERYGRLKIEIIGGGDEYENIREKAERVNEELGYECVKMLGSVGDPSCYMAECDVFVGVSRAAIEAMSCGVRVILAGNEGFLGMLDEHNIELARESNFCARGMNSVSDEKLFCEICRSLELSAEKARKIGSFLREFVIREHSISISAQRTVIFYQRVIDGVSFDSGSACICGYYGFGNTGDDTLLEESIKRARKRFGGGIVALTKKPARDKYRFGVPCVSRSDLFEVVKALRKTECLVFGGGTLFQDRTSLRSLFYYVFIAVLARVLGARVELWGNGLGEIKSGIGRAAVACALKKACYIGLRDKHSIEIAKGLGVKEDKLCYEKDLAYRTEGCDTEALRRLMKLADIREGDRFAVIAVSGRCEEKEYLRLKKRASELSQKGVKLLFVGMFPREDRETSLRTCAETGGIYLEQISGSELVSLLGKAAIACGMRLHLLVFAKAAGTDFEGYSNDPKIIAFCKEYGSKD